MSRAITVEVYQACEEATPAARRFYGHIAHPDRRSTLGSIRFLGPTAEAVHEAAGKWWAEQMAALDAKQANAEKRSASITARAAIAKASSPPSGGEG